MTSTQDRPPRDLSLESSVLFRVVSHIYVQDVHTTYTQLTPLKSRSMQLHGHRFGSHQTRVPHTAPALSFTSLASSPPQQQSRARTPLPPPHRWCRGAHRRVTPLDLPPALARPVRCETFITWLMTVTTPMTSAVNSRRSIHECALCLALGRLRRQRASRRHGIASDCL